VSVGEIRLDGSYTAAARLDRRHDRGGVSGAILAVPRRHAGIALIWYAEVRDENGGAALSQDSRGRSSNSVVCARDQRDMTLQRA
jgi:hypothetical protein